MEYSQFVKLNKFEDYKTQPLIIRVENEEVISEFYSLYKQEKDGSDMHPYYLSCTFNELSNNNKIKCFIIKMTDGDYIFLPFKVVQMYSAKYIRLIGSPKSKNNNPSNVNKVLKHLSLLSFIKQVFSNKHDVDILGKYFKFSSDIVDCDNFSNIKDALKKFDTHRWKNRNRINWINSNNFVFKPADISDINSVDNLNQCWKMFKKDVMNDNVFDKCLPQNISNAIFDNKYSNLVPYVFYYNNILIGYVVYILEGSRAMQILNKSAYCVPNVIMLINSGDNEKTRKILDKTTRHITYLSYLDLAKRNIDFVYSAGTVGKSDLNIYKQQVNTDIINYYKGELIN